MIYYSNHTIMFKFSELQEQVNYSLPYKLLDWINIPYISLLFLYQNPAAIHFLEANHFLENNQDKIIWSYLTVKPAAIRLSEKYKIIWSFLSANTSAIHILEQNQDKIDWLKLSSNPAAIQLLEANQDKINWCELSSNPAAIHLLEANQDKIDWYRLSRNPAAMST